MPQGKRLALRREKKNVLSNENRDARRMKGTKEEVTWTNNGRREGEAAWFRPNFANIGPGKSNSSSC